MQDDSATVLDSTNEKIIKTTNVGSTPEGTNMDYTNQLAYTANWVVMMLRS